AADDVIEAHAGGGEHRAEVLHHLSGLGAHVTWDQLPGHRVERDLAGEEHHPRGRNGDRLRVGADGLRSLQGLDDGSVHAPPATPSAGARQLRLRALARRRGSRRGRSRGQYGDGPPGWWMPRTPEVTRGPPVAAPRKRPFPLGVDAPRRRADGLQAQALPACFRRSPIPEIPASTSPALARSSRTPCARTTPARSSAGSTSTPTSSPARGSSS